MERGKGKRILGGGGEKKREGKREGKEEKNEEGEKKYHRRVRTRDLPRYRHRLSPQGRIAHTITNFHFDDLIVAALTHACSLHQKLCCIMYCMGIFCHAYFQN